MPRVLREIMPAARSRNREETSPRSKLETPSSVTATDLSKDKCSIILRRVNARINDRQKKKKKEIRWKREEKRWRKKRRNDVT